MTSELAQSRPMLASAALVAHMATTVGTVLTSEVNSAGQTHPLRSFAASLAIQELRFLRLADELRPRGNIGRHKPARRFQNAPSPTYTLMLEPTA